MSLCAYMLMCAQICACVCNFLYPLSKRNQRLGVWWKQRFTNLGHLSTAEIRQDTKAKDLEDSDAHLQASRWPQARSFEHPILERV